MSDRGALADLASGILQIKSDLDRRHLPAYQGREPLMTIDFWDVEEPGRLRRSWADGSAVRTAVTPAEHLRQLGLDPTVLVDGEGGFLAAQYASINPWGFMGLGFGEAVLIDLGYYTAQEVLATVDDEQVAVPSYHAGELPDETWRSGRRSHTYFDESSAQWRVGTDVNCWAGSFTGKDGVQHVRDLREAPAQHAVLRSSMRRNANILDRFLRRHGDDLWTWHRGGLSTAALLAASHLTSPYAVIAQLRGREERVGGAGTTLVSRLHALTDIEVRPEDLA